MQRADFNWFLNNYEDLYKKYGHKFLVVKDKNVIGAFDSVREALSNTSEPLGTYILQECTGEESAYSNFIASPFIV